MIFHLIKNHKFHIVCYKNQEKTIVKNYLKLDIIDIEQVFRKLGNFVDSNLQIIRDIFHSINSKISSDCFIVQNEMTHEYLLCIPCSKFIQNAEKVKKEFLLYCAIPEKIQTGDEEIILGLASEDFSCDIKIKEYPLIQTISNMDELINFIQIFLKDIEQKIKLPILTFLEK